MSRPAIGLITASLLQVAALAVMATLPQWVEVLPTTTPEEQASAVVVGIAMGQAALAALSIVMAPTSKFVRAAGGAMLIAGAFLASVAFHRQADRGEELLLTASIIGALLLIVWLEALAIYGLLASWGKFALRHATIEHVVQRPAQFHLWHLLATMTAVGGLLALGRAAWGPLRTELELDPEQYVQLLGVAGMIATTCAVIAIYATVSLLAPRHGLLMWGAGIVLVGLASASEVYTIELFNGPHAERWHWRMNYSTFAWITISLLPARLAGWTLRGARC